MSFEMSAVVAGEHSPRLPNHSRHNNNNNNNNKRISSNSNGKSQLDDETRINVRNLFAAATAGAPRPVTPIGGGHSSSNNSNSRWSGGGGGTNDAVAGTSPARQNRVLSPEILLSAANKNRNGSTASVYTNSVNLTVPDGGGGAVSNGDVLSAAPSIQSESSRRGGGKRRNRSGGGGDAHTAEGGGGAAGCLASVKSNCCSIYLKKTLFGLVVMVLVTVSWTGTTQLLKSTYTGAVTDFIFYGNRSSDESNVDVGAEVEDDHGLVVLGGGGGTREDIKNSSNSTSDSTRSTGYSAPFFTTWFCSMGTTLFLPLYLICQVCCRGCGLSKATPSPSGVSSTTTGSLREAVRGIRDKGFTPAKFLGRCCLFSLLWLLTNYLYVSSLKILGPTEVIALFATNVSFIYLLSWVVLHEQFVGIRIVAVILCNTGIALLAYMDGITQTPTLGGVVLGAAASAGSAVYKVMFKRTMGVVTFCQVAVFFSLIGLCSTLLFWPVALALTFSGAETVKWDDLPWVALTGSLLLALVANLLANFGIVVTYEAFITLGLILAVPTSAVVDWYLYSATFNGMRLAGLILIACGFIVVMLPSNWPDAIHTIIRWGRRRNQRENEGSKRPPPDLRTGHIGSRLRSPSGRVK